jgi:ribonuclease P/MRP protein subunit RPP40
MKHGKGAFSRLEWACKNVLNQSVTWLFYNFNPSSAESLAEGKEPISKLAPRIQKFEKIIVRLDESLCPKILPSDLTTLYDEQESLSMLEYLRLLGLNSPRLNAKDDIDPHLSRYEVPDFGSGVATRNLIGIRWKGFIPPAFVRDIFLCARSHCSTNKSKMQGSDAMDIDSPSEEQQEQPWFSLTAESFGAKTSHTILQFRDNSTLTWSLES